MQAATMGPQKHSWSRGGCYWGGQEDMQASGRLHTTPKGLHAVMETRPTWSAAALQRAKPGTCCQPQEEEEANSKDDRDRVPGGRVAE